MTKRFLIAVLGLLLLNRPTFADMSAQGTTLLEQMRISIHPTQIAIDTRGIFAYIEGEWTPVESVGTDANGFYAIRSVDPYHGKRWTCPRCKYRNNPGDDFCQNWLYNNSGRYQCLHPRPE